MPTQLARPWQGTAAATAVVGRTNQVTAGLSWMVLPMRGRRITHTLQR